jgi:hypothetical protein
VCRSHRFSCRPHLAVDFYQPCECCGLFSFGSLLFLLVHLLLPLLVAGPLQRPEGVSCELRLSIQLVEVTLHLSDGSFNLTGVVSLPLRCSVVQDQLSQSSSQLCSAGPAALGHIDQSLPLRSPFLAFARLPLLFVTPVWCLLHSRLLRSGW